MISVDDLVALVRTYNPKTDEALIRAAYDYGRAMHEGQFRHSGEPCSVVQRVGHECRSRWSPQL